MRVVGEIPHPVLKITIFHWNNKYLIKLENGPLEQTFKLPDYEISSDEEIKEMITAEFLDQAVFRFDEMRTSLEAARTRS